MKYALQFLTQVRIPDIVWDDGSPVFRFEWKDALESDSKRELRKAMPNLKEFRIIERGKQ